MSTFGDAEDMATVDTGNYSDIDDLPEVSTVSAVGPVEPKSSEPTRKSRASPRATEVDAVTTPVSKLPPAFVSTKNNNAFTRPWWKELSQKDAFWDYLYKSIPENIWKKRLTLQFVRGLEPVAATTTTAIAEVTVVKKSAAKSNDQATETNGATIGDAGPTESIEGAAPVKAKPKPRVKKAAAKPKSAETGNGVDTAATAVVTANKRVTKRKVKDDAAEGTPAAKRKKATDTTATVKAKTTSRKTETAAKVSNDESVDEEEDQVDDDVQVVEGVEAITFHCPKDGKMKEARKSVQIGNGAISKKKGAVEKEAIDINTKKPDAQVKINEVFKVVKSVQRTETPVETEEVEVANGDKEKANTDQPRDAAAGGPIESVSHGVTGADGTAVDTKVSEEDDGDADQEDNAEAEDTAEDLLDAVMKDKSSQEE